MIITGAWVIDILSCRGWIIPTVAHGLADVGTASVTMITGVWLVVRHYRGPRLQPGDVVTTIEEKRAAERLVIETIAAIHGESCPFSQQQRDRLRAV